MSCRLDFQLFPQCIIHIYLEHIGHISAYLVPVGSKSTGTKLAPDDTTSIRCTTPTFADTSATKLYMYYTAVYRYYTRCFMMPGVLQMVSR